MYTVSVNGWRQTNSTWNVSGGSISTRTELPPTDPSDRDCGIDSRRSLPSNKGTSYQNNYVRVPETDAYRALQLIY